MERKLNVGWKLVAVVLVSVLLQPWVALGADITPGYTFSSGEANVTHTKLNNSASGTINTSFLSGKSSAGSNPNTAFEILLRDTSLDVYKKTTIGALLDHSGLIDGRSVVTTPGMGFLWLVSDSGAYKAIAMTNAAFGGNLTAPTNDTRLGFVNAGGTLTSLTLSNLIAGATTQTEVTNTDRYLMLSGLDGSVKGVTAQTMITGAVRGSNFSGNDVLLSYDGTRLRSNRATNLIDGLGATNTAPAAEAAFSVLEDGQLQKLFFDSLRQAVAAYTLNVTQSVYSVATNISASSGSWSSIADIGSSSLTATLVPKGTNAAIKVLVRVVLQGTSQGGGDNGYLRVLRGGNAIGVGDDDGASRVEAGASIGNDSNASTTTYEFLDTTGPTNTVYAVQVGGVSGNTLYINRDSSDANSTANGRFISTITLQEVHQ